MATCEMMMMMKMVMTMTSMMEMVMHSGLPGGGLRFSGNIFRVPFFRFFGFPTCQMIRKKYSNIRGNPFPV